jgi:hypothetical protein
VTDATTIFEQGNLATVIKVVPQCAIQMSVYDYMKDVLQVGHLDRQLSNMERLVAGASYSSTILNILSFLAGFGRYCQ